LNTTNTPATKPKIIDQENNFELSSTLANKTNVIDNQLRFNNKNNFINEANFTDKQSNLGIESISSSSYNNNNNNSNKQYISNKSDFRHKLKTSSSNNFNL